MAVLTSELVDDLAATGLKSVTRTLTSAEILALSSSPVEILPAIPNTNYWIVGAYGVYHKLTTDYTASGFTITLAQGASEFGWINDSSLIQNGSYGRQFVATGPAVGTTTPGDPVTLTIDTSDPTDGDGTLDVTVLYREVTV